MNIEINYILPIFLIGFLFLAPSQSTAQETAPLDDREISRMIDLELLMHKDVDSKQIDIETKEGIVVLSGTVDNILAKDRASSIVLSIRGVRGVVNNIEAAVPRVSDVALLNNVLTALLNDPTTESYDVRVEVKNGTVTLHGEVDSWQEMILSREIAKGVRGVKEVVSNLTIEQPETREDYEILQDVRGVLEHDVRVDAGLVKVQVKDATVILSGKVGSAAEKAQAEILAWVPGTRMLESDELKVAEWADITDHQKVTYAHISDTTVQEAVADALHYNPRVSSQDISVFVKKGMVNLYGTVSSLAAKRAAGRTAKNIVGVTSIDNYLEVKTPLSDNKTLEKRVKEALQMNPDVDRYQVDITAMDGEVYLQGEVDSYFEKYRVEDIACNQRGVMKVYNKLNVTDERAFNAEYYEADSSDPYNVMPVFTSTNIYEEPLSNEELERNVKNQLWWSPFVDSSTIQVEAGDGTVTLSGNVATPYERKRATENALEGGAVTVVNDLTIR